MYIHCVKFYTETDRVDFTSLYKHIIPCITDWEDLGVHLGLQPHELDYISRDNDCTSNRTKNCCRAVLRKWLKVELSPTWGKL